MAINYTAASLALTAPLLLNALAVRAYTKKPIFYCIASTFIGSPFYCALYTLQSAYNFDYKKAKGSFFYLLCHPLI